MAFLSSQLPKCLIVSSEIKTKIIYITRTLMPLITDNTNVIARRSLHI